MDEEQRKNQIKYLTEVLGIKKIFLENEMANKPDLIVFVENYKALTTSESDLLAKMIEALKLTEQTVMILDLEKQSENTKSKYQIYLVNNPQDWQQKISASSVVTFSPTVLSVKTQLKKEAWTELQKTIAFFKTN